MRYFYLVIILLTLAVAKASAANMNFTYQPGNVSRSSATNGAAGLQFISTHTATLFTVFIASRGSADATIEIWDAKLSTQNVNRLVDIMNCGSVAQIDSANYFNVWASSGIAAVITGTVPCKATFLYKVGAPSFAP